MEQEKILITLRKAKKDLAEVGRSHNRALTYCGNVLRELEEVTRNVRESHDKLDAAQIRVSTLIELIEEEKSETK